MAIAIDRPAIELVESRRLYISIVAQVGAGEAIRLPRVDHVRRTVSVCLAPALAHEDRCGIPGRIHFDSVLTWLPKAERKVRRVDLEHLTRIETTHMDVQGALSQFQLGDLIVEVENRYAGVGAHSDRRAADLDFCAGTCIGPKTVAIGQRPVDRCLDPIVLARGRVTDRAVDVAQTRDTRGRVGTCRAAEGEHCEAGQQRHRWPAKRLFEHDDSLRECAPYTRAAAVSAAPPPRGNEVVPARAARQFRALYDVSNMVRLATRHESALLCVRRLFATAQCGPVGSGSVRLRTDGTDGCSLG